MKYKDPVQVLRDAITSATGAQTVRVIQEGSLPDTWPMPLVHVYATQSQDLDFERITSLVVDVYATTPTGPGVVGAEALADEVVDALSVRPVVGASGWVDEASVPSLLGVHAAYGVVEVVGLSVEVTQRPTD